MKENTPLPGVINYLTGSDSSKWISGVHRYESIRCISAYHDTDILFYLGKNGLEFDFILKPGANPNEIGISFGGSEHVSVDDDGNLIISAGISSISLLKPKVIQVSEESQQEISSAYQLGDGGVVRLKLGAYNPAIDLIIDPAIVYSTFLGGTEQSLGEGAYGVSVDSEGNAYVIGYTSVPDFPTENAQQSSLYGSADVFVSKIKRGGQELEFSTYLGGSTMNLGTEIALDSYNNVYLAGYTNSTDFPVKDALQSDLIGTANCFITKFAPDGKALIFSTYFGGTGYDYGSAIALDAQNSAHVIGSTTSADFPLMDATQSLYGGNTDAFFSIIKDDGSALLYSSCLGGNNTEIGNAIAVSLYGDVLAGVTMSDDFPTVDPIQPSLMGVSDAFITSISSGEHSLSISMNASEKCIYLGQTLDYIIRLSKNGFGVAGKITVKDTLP